MATTVTTTWEQDEKYTWASCPYTWGEMVQAWKYAGTPVSFTTNVAEDNEIADNNYKDSTHLEFEGIILEDNYFRDCEVICAEKLDVYSLATNTVDFIRHFTSSIALSSGWGKDFETSKSESFSAVDSNYKEFEKTINAEIEILDSISRTFKVWRTFDEGLTTEETAIKEFEKLSEEDIEVHDAYVRNADGIISNLYIEAEDMDEDEFTDIVNTPGGGYTRFYEFKVGEYEYQEALVRLTIETTVYQSEPNIVNVVMNVDIPDTDDSGVEVITDTESATKVYFNKSYYTTPEVAVIVIGGNTGDGVLYANLVSVDGEDDAGRYFEVEILNSSGELTTGTISWFSKGY